MTKKLEIIHGLVWITFVVFTFNLFVPDYKHTFAYSDPSGQSHDIYGNHDFQLKFIMFVLLCIPLMIMTFIKHSNFSKITSLVLSIIMLLGYYKFSFANSEYGYYSYDRDDFAGYAPYAGFYVVGICVFIFFILSILKVIQTTAKKVTSNQDILDNF
jgi:hypothetical protein